MDAKKTHNGESHDPYEMSIRNSWVIVMVVLYVIGFGVLAAKYLLGVPGQAVAVVLNVLIAICIGIPVIYELRNKRYLAAALSIILLILIIAV